MGLGKSVRSGRVLDRCKSTAYCRARWNGNSVLIPSIERTHAKQWMTACRCIMCHFPGLGEQRWQLYAYFLELTVHNLVAGIEKRGIKTKMMEQVILSSTNTVATEKKWEQQTKKKKLCIYRHKWYGISVKGEKKNCKCSYKDMYRWAL